jgi:dihydrodipicolinate synthase/N-acetylneuraminate lyase
MGASERQSPLPAAPVAAALAGGGVIPAHPLALTAQRRLDERRQRALTRYYVEAGATGLAVGVHTTQFAIRSPQVGLLEPVLALASETMDASEAARPGRPPLVRIAGICGPTGQALGEARLARELGYHLGLVNLAALRDASEDTLIDHARALAEVLPLMGFYLQPAVGGRPLDRGFWRRFAEIANVVAIKVAPFDRYRTLDVAHGVAASGRAASIALYTGNDDNIVGDLITPLPPGALRFVGGLLGQWAVWTARATQLMDEIRRATAPGASVPGALLALAAQLTDANAALFDAAGGFRGCIPGIHEALRRQGLLEGTWCLDPDEQLSPGQAEEIDRIWAAYPHLRDDRFVAENRERWLSP